MKKPSMYLTRNWTVCLSLPKNFYFLFFVVDMVIKIKFFASLREIVGEEEISMEKDDLKDVGDVLKKISLSSNKIQKRFYDDGSTLNKNLIVLKDGRNINYLDGLNTSVEEDDTIAVFPVIAGG